MHGVQIEYLKALLDEYRDTKKNYYERSTHPNYHAQNYGDLAGSFNRRWHRNYDERFNGGKEITTEQLFREMQDDRYGRKYGAIERHPYLDDRNFDHTWILHKHDRGHPRIRR